MSVTLVLASMLLPQAAASPADTADARCMLAVAVVGMKEKNKLQEMRLTGIATFFAAKIVGRSGPSAVEAAARSVDGEEVERNAKDILKACKAEGLEVMRSLRK